MPADLKNIDSLMFLPGCSFTVLIHGAGSSVGWSGGTVSRSVEYDSPRRTVEVDPRYREIFTVKLYDMEFENNIFGGGLLGAPE